MTTQSVRSLGSRITRFESTSAVQTSTGASRLIAASPVIIPTLRAPNASQSAKNFSLTSALIGQV